MKLTKPTLKIPPQLFDAVYKLPSWQKLLILLAAWSIPIALFWFLFLSARLGEIDSISSKLPRLKQEIAVLEAKSKKLPELEQELTIMKGILKKAVRLLPQKEDIPSVLTEISSLGNEARLEFVSFQPKKEQPVDFYAAIPVSMEFRGPFHNTLVFFDRISRMARIVHIKEVSMGKAQESTEVWSQTGKGPQGAGNVKASGASAKIQGANTGKASGVQRGGNWVIETRCTAVTYRFLSPEEQHRLRNKNANRNRRR